MIRLVKCDACEYLPKKYIVYAIITDIEELKGSFLVEYPWNDTDIKDVIESLVKFGDIYTKGFSLFLNSYLHSGNPFSNFLLKLNREIKLQELYG